MLGTCLEAACQDKKERDNREQYLKAQIESRKAAELLLSLRIEQLQEQVQQKRKENQNLVERVEMMLMWAPSPPEIVQIRKLIVYPEEWDGNIWGDPDNSKPKENYCPFQILLYMKPDPL